MVLNIQNMSICTGTTGILPPTCLYRWTAIYGKERYNPAKWGSLYRSNTNYCTVNMESDLHPQQLTPSDRTNMCEWYDVWSCYSLRVHIDSLLCTHRQSALYPLMPRHPVRLQRYKPSSPISPWNNSRLAYSIYRTGAIF